MDIKDRIDRRRVTQQDDHLVVDGDVLTPVTHLREPVGRETVLKALLDALDPVFEGELPDDVAVVGPRGTGKTAVTEALLTQLDRHLGGGGTAIRTTTRSGDHAQIRFVSVDCRRATSVFKFYRTLLDALTAEQVPARGIGTDALRTRLEEALADANTRAIVAVDHLFEQGTPAPDEIRSYLEPIEDSVAVLSIGREAPDWTADTITVDPYSERSLLPIISERASRGLASDALDHEQARTIAAWANGDAHDALAALTVAAGYAERADADGIDESHVAEAIDHVPANGVHVGRILALPDNRQTVLHELPEAPAGPISEVAEDVAGHCSLSPGTVERFCYELTDLGILERVPLDHSGVGRGPSTVQPRYPPLVVERCLAAHE